MIRDLQSHEEIYTDNISNWNSSEIDLFYKRSKRFKDKCASQKRKIYTGKQILNKFSIINHEERKRKKN